MVHDAWLLMQLYWKLDRREIGGQSQWRILLLLLGGFAVLAIGAASAFVGFGLSFLAQPDLPVHIPPGLVPGLILTFVLIGVLFTGLNQSVKALFLSGDLDQLMVAPIHARSVMMAKLLGRLPSTLLLLFAVAGPAFAGYGIGMGAGPVYYVVGALLLLFAPLFGLSLGAVLAMLLVRWLPVNRLSELLAAAYAFVGIAIALLFQLPRLFLDDGGFTFEVESATTMEPFNQFVGAIERLPIPTLWAGRGLMALDAGAIDATGLLGIGVYLIITIGLFILIIMTADRLYLSGWLKTQSAGGKRRGLEARGGVFGGRSLAAAIGYKDWLLRLRDPRQLISLLGGGFIAIVVGGLAIFRGNGGDMSLMDSATGMSTEGPVVWRVFTSIFSSGVIIASYAFFVGYVFLSNMALYALALEGRSFPLLKSAPVRPRDVWQAKLRGIYLPFIVVFVLALMVAWFFTRYSLAWLPYTLVTGFVLGYGLLAMNITLGFRFANLEWTDPRRMVTQGGGLFSLILTVIYGVPASLLVALGFGLSLVFPQWSLLPPVVALALLVALTWGLHILMTRWAESAWDKLPA
ncbi:MAG: hypothetical protein KBF17_09525 [Candidatus Promineofilum sp.]|nr:hypothetical protein [Promineifilum sp.]MBP9656694.1 hypothetical protein [Promineifilum sp.]